ncbi:MAG TPA: MCE family protein [Pseudonocardiaceae bacterium]|nr:MCE family protein [Pseudonocardiaceae bacterium]
MTATIKYRNLLGQRYIALDQGVGPLNQLLRPGATIGIDRTHPALDLTDLFNGFKPLFQALSPADVNQLSNEIVQVLQGEGTTVDSLVAHTASLTTALAGKDQVIGRTIDNLNSVLNTVNSRGSELSDMVTTLQQLVSGLSQDRTPIGDAISGLSALTTSTANLLQLGRGTAATRHRGGSALCPPTWPTTPIPSPRSCTTCRSNTRPSAPSRPTVPGSTSTSARRPSPACPHRTEVRRRPVSR